MSERLSSQHPKVPPRESSVTRARFDLPPRASIAADPSGSDATIISSRPLIGDSGAARLLPNLEIGRMLEGERLGHFELRSFVGGGGMGVVFRAWDTSLSREVAVKVLSREQSADEETLRRFRNEAQSAARLDHANIARVYYVGEDRGVHFIVFEFIEGVNLRDLVDRRGQLPIDEAVDYTLQIARALDHASQRDVIHRDIKPSNVLITAEGQAKLVDMGLARLHQVEHPDNDLTASGVTLGTFDYISPEQARDPRSADVRSDLYSLGCSLFFMLVGKPPFPHGTVLQKLLQHQGDEPPDPRSFRSDLPDDLVRILRKLLAKNPTQRHQTPAELIWDLSSFTDRLAAGIPSPVTRRLPVGPLLSPQALRVLSWVLPFVLLVAATWLLDFMWSHPSARGRTAPATTEETAPADRNGLPGQDSKASLRTKSAATTSSAIAQNGTTTVTGPASAKSNDTMGRPSAAGTGVITSVEAPAASPSSPASPLPTVKPGNPLEQLLDKLYSAVSPIRQLSDASPTVPSRPNPDEAGGATPQSPTADNTTTTPPNRPGNSSEPAPPNAKPKVTANMQPPLVVGAPADGAAFVSLEAACLAAQPGDIIELKFNGRMAERPLRFSTAKLTLRAATGYRPVVRFVPAIDVLNPAAAMVQLESGSISATGIEFEFEPPSANGAKSWSLFQLSAASQLQLSQSTLTIVESPLPAAAAQRSRVSFIEVAAPSAANRSLPMPVEAAVASDEYPTLELNDVIARGNGTFLRVAPGVSARLSWNNGLLVTRERLVEAGGPGTGKGAVRLEIDLRHLTAEMQAGLALLDFSAADAAPMVADFKVSGSILHVGTSAPLIDYIASQQAGRGDNEMRWRGDRNFYEGINVFWRLRDPGTSGTAQQLTFAEWQAYWTPARETLPSANAVVWQQPIPNDRLSHEAQANEYLLGTEAKQNPARGGANDGQDAGAILHRLP
jgi:serine/threonine-protein kinase